jgi:uncharacterized protein (DUF4415 family)
MISDEPDEDADDLDDEAALDYCMDHDQLKRNAAAADLPDWPPPVARDIGLNLDAETLAWFKATHTNWRSEMRFVLRAWIVANSVQRQAAPPLRIAAPMTEDDRLKYRP